MPQFGNEKRHPRDAQQKVDWMEVGFPPTKLYRWIIFVSIITMLVGGYFLYYERILETIASAILIPVMLSILRYNRFNWLKKTNRWKKEWDKK